MNNIQNTLSFTPALFREVGIRAHKLEVGEMGYTTEGWFSDGRHYVLRTSAGVVDLTNPAQYWPSSLESTDWAFPTIIKLRAGDAITITQGLNSVFIEEVKVLYIINKLEAIKRVREVTGWPLKEAKTYADNLGK